MEFIKCILFYFIGLVCVYSFLRLATLAITKSVTQVIIQYKEKYENEKEKEQVSDKKQKKVSI